METIKTIYKIGHGPSSSHTMAPRRAAEMFAKRFEGSLPNRFRVTLYGSLAATGKGHMTDVAILDVLEPLAPTKILWEPTICLLYTSHLEVILRLQRHILGRILRWRTIGCRVDSEDRKVARVPRPLPIVCVGTKLTDTARWRCH